MAVQPRYDQVSQQTNARDEYSQYQGRSVGAGLNFREGSLRKKGAFVNEEPLTGDSRAA